MWLELGSVGKSLLDIVEWLSKHARSALWAISLVWIAYALWSLVEQSDTQSPDLLADLHRWVLRNEPEVHLLGLAALASALVLTVFPYRRALRIAGRVLRSGTGIENNSSGDLITELEVQQKLREFSRDAVTINILANDADFLSPDSPQNQEVAKRGRSCRILLSSDPRPGPSALKQLIDAGVQIRAYPVDGTVQNVHLRGRLKTTPFGTSACLFDKTSHGYRIINLTNQTLVRLVEEQFNDWFSRGRNPLIRHVILDIAGVAFDGDIHDFYGKLNKLLGLTIRTTAIDYSIVDSDLNLGKYDIVQAVERKIGREIDEGQATQVQAYWSSTWSLNSGVAQLVRRLATSGLRVSLCSNCDRENADVYFVRGFFDNFDNVLLSCQLGVLKPSVEFFQKILDQLQVEPWQCVFVDDDPTAVNAAAEIGFHAFNMPRGIEAEDKANYVRGALTRLDVIPDMS